MSSNPNIEITSMYSGGMILQANKLPEWYAFPADRPFFAFPVDSEAGIMCRLAGHEPLDAWMASEVYGTTVKIQFCWKCDYTIGERDV